MPSQKPLSRVGRPYHHGDLRAALIHAAFREVERLGPEGVSLKALAHTLGVSQPAPFRHFIDREALLSAVAVEGFHAFSKALEAAAAAEGSTALASMASAYVRFGREHIGLYRLMFGSRLLACAVPNSDLSQAALASFALLEAKVTSALTPSSARKKALGVWAALHGLVMLDHEQLLSGDLAKGIEIESLIDDVVTAAEEPAKD
ncbi:TetR/AcrR family transcriptional regulator [Mesorhizobium carmichaelinearum]|uniref:TetR/AcrR family transcriptional regulator n=1 Tax=Mesorhizobium carmichaelinearum TaxID=1208188 RepID=UPI000BA2C1DF|nr:TetR/AcrR family transcriptional regulator [Mesorhizobium carmichaelinearum]